MLRFSAHLGYMFTERPLAERFAAARRAGFRVVEHPNPYGLPAGVVRALLEENELEFVQFALPAGNVSAGEKGFAALPGREVEFRRSVETGLGYARGIGASFIQVQSGLTPTDADFNALWKTYLANLSFAAEAGEAEGVTVLVEPIGKATIAGYFMDSSDLALRALGEVGHPNIRLLFDVFHSANANVDPNLFIRTQVSRIGHMHIAEFPGRNQPGTGSLDFASLFRTIESSGYSGIIGCEYKPSGVTEESLDWYQTYKIS